MSFFLIVDTLYKLSALVHLKRHANVRTLQQGNHPLLTRTLRGGGWVRGVWGRLFGCYLYILCFLEARKGQTTILSAVVIGLGTKRKLGGGL